MSAVTFFLGFLAGATAATAVAGTWLARAQAAHFAQMLAQIKALGPHA
jgi:hypothetical protein